MKLVVQVKPLPDADTDAALRETLLLANRAANHFSRRASDTGVKGKTFLQRLVYGDLKAMGLSAQPAIHVARKTAGAYATLKANLKAGNYGPRGFRRRAQAESSATPQGCSACGHIHRKNRPDQSTFACTSCGFAEHADVNAARNIASRGVAGWAVSHAADDAA